MANLGEMPEISGIGREIIRKAQMFSEYIFEDLTRRCDA